MAILPSSRPYIHNAHLVVPSSPYSTVILNAVKDLRLPLRPSKWRYFPIADYTPGTIPIPPVSNEIGASHIREITHS